MEQDYLISNKVYNILKWVVMIFLPAFATLYITLAQVWDFPNPDDVVTTCAALATFLGILIGVGTRSWNNSEGKYDGELAITGQDPDTGNPDLSLKITRDPNELAAKRTIRLKSISNPVE
jgi:hypothetical protein